MSKKKILAATLTAVMSIGVLTGCGGQADNKVAKVTPTFMYFVSSSDADFAQTNTMVHELEEQYGDEVNFNIINIDEDSEAAKNFPVQDNTPALIMLNEANDISAIEFKCSDKSKLEADINAALGK